jgi:hypothetical protein
MKLISIFYFVTAPMEDLSNVKLEPDEGELELQLALNMARKLKQRKELMARPSLAETVS